MASDWPYHELQDLRRGRNVNLPPVTVPNPLLVELLNMLPIMRDPVAPTDWSPYPGWRQSSNVEVRPDISTAVGRAYAASPVGRAELLSILGAGQMQPKVNIDLDKFLKNQLSLDLGAAAIKTPPGAHLRSWNVPFDINKMDWPKQPLIVNAPPPIASSQNLGFSDWIMPPKPLPIPHMPDPTQPGGHMSLEEMLDDMGVAGGKDLPGQAVPSKIADEPQPEEED